MGLSGTTLSFPCRADLRGTLAVVADEALLVEQAIRDVVETRQGERAMLPDYGIPDFVFAVQDVGFAARLSYFIAQQVERYVPLVDTVEVAAGRVTDAGFEATLAAEPSRAAVALTYTLKNAVTAPRNLVFPVWQLV